MEFIQGIVTWRGGGTVLPLALLGKVMFYAVLTLFTDIPAYIHNRQERMLEWPWIVRGMIFAGMLILLILLRPLDDTPFIYFQF